MKKEIKDKWVEALRSGDYPQTKGCLRNTKGFCCLGVASDLYVKEVGGKWEQTGYRDEFQFLGNTAALSEKVRVWLGMSSSSGLFKDGDKVERLTDLNDNGIMFKEIADIVEKHWEQL